MTTAVDINWHVKLRSQADAEGFAICIRDAVVKSLAPREYFSAKRLEMLPMRYNDFMHPKYLGLASHADIQVREGAGGAIALAGTVVHELAHSLCGIEYNHSAVWADACNFLGLKNTDEAATYTSVDFSDELLETIKAAIERFAAEHPGLVYDPQAVIPLPPHVGGPDCPEAESHREDCSFGHKKHIYQFQMDGVRWMLQNDRKGLLNADEMGLGKTVEDILYINAVHPQRILVIAPNNVKYVWYEHFMDLCVHEDIKQSVGIGHSKLYPFTDVVIINYEAAIKWLDFIKAEPWDLLIFDEMHYLKTPNTKRSKACYSLEAKMKIGNTGSPIVNYPAEFFPIAHYLARDLFPEWGGFAIKYEGSGHRFGRNLNHLNNLARSTFMLRRLKKDVLKELPMKRRQIFQFEADDEQKKLIEKELEMFQQLQGDLDAESIRLVNALKNESDVIGDDVDWMKLIENLKSTKRFAFTEMSRLAHLIGLAKVPIAIEHITNVLENREKCIVFGHHRDVLSQIAKHFAPHSVLLLGGGPDQAAATAAAASRFSNDDDCKVFVGGITLAAGYSLKSASTVVFVEQDWVPGIITQAEDRSHGIGRGDAEANSLLIQHLVFKDSLDTKKAQLTIRKQKSIDRAIGNPTKR